MSNTIKAYYLFEQKHCIIQPSKVRREWMDRTASQFAYRCMPLTIANQIAYDVLAPSNVKIIWDGNPSTDGIQIYYEDLTKYRYAVSHFGSGILTIQLDFILRTPKDICVYVKGSANNPKNCLYPLEGIVETHWLPFTFTYNYKFTSPGEISFEKDEPLFSFLPLDISFVESFSIDVDSINSDIDFKNSYEAYSTSRTEFLKSGSSGWQKHYAKGMTPDSEEQAEGHRSKVVLKKVDYSSSGS